MQADTCFSLVGQVAPLLFYLDRADGAKNMTIFSYKRHINNWRQDTAQLTLEQRGAYSELMDWFYSTNGFLPADIKKIHRLLGVQTQSERRAIAEVIKLFFEEKNGFLYQNGCVKELKAIHEKSEKARQSADAKHNKNKNLPSANAHANAHADVVLSMNHEPVNNKEVYPTDKLSLKSPPTPPLVDKKDFLKIGNWNGIEAALTEKQFLECKSLAPRYDFYVIVSAYNRWINEKIACNMQPPKKPFNHFAAFIKTHVKKNPLT